MNILKTILYFIILTLLFNSCTGCTGEIKPKDLELSEYTLMDDDLSALDPLEEAVMMNRSLERLVIHCTAQDIRWPFTVETLTRFFIEQRGWSKVGYTFFIDRDGNLWKLNEAWNWDEVVDYQEITFGARGFNSTSLHIVWDGGMYKGKITDNRTDAQRITLRTFVTIFRDKYPNLDIMGHRDLGANKECPVYNVKEEYSDLAL